jgi:hypothetical protein
MSRYPPFLLSSLLLSLLFCSGCLSLTTLQSGRTVGKDNFDFVLSGTYGKSLEVPPGDRDRSNEMPMPVLGVDVQSGLGEKTDWMLHLDIATYLGVGLKHQFLGNSDSRFAASLGAEVGINTGYLLLGGRNFYFTMPLYTSYEVAENFMLCISPRFLYQDGKYRGLLSSGTQTYYQSHARLGMSWGFLWGRNTKFGLEISSFGGAFFQPSQVSTGVIFNFNAEREKRQRKRRVIRRQMI